MSWSSAVLTCRSHALVIISAPNEHGLRLATVPSIRTTILSSVEQAARSAFERHFGTFPNNWMVHQRIPDWVRNVNDTTFLLWTFLSRTRQTLSRYRGVLDRMMAARDETIAKAFPNYALVDLCPATRNASLPPNTALSAEASTIIGYVHDQLPFNTPVALGPSVRLAASDASEKLDDGAEPEESSSPAQPADRFASEPRCTSSTNEALSYTYSHAVAGAPSDVPVAESGRNQESGGDRLSTVR
jgi:hypothetical protein